MKKKKTPTPPTLLLLYFLHFKGSLVVFALVILGPKKNMEGVKISSSKKKRFMGKNFRLRFFYPAFVDDVGDTQIFFRDRENFENF